MSNINTFLRVMNKMGYPNPSTESIANSIGYNLDHIIIDLVKEIGEIKTNEFTERSLSKLNKDGKGIKVPLMDDNYVYVVIHQSRIDLSETESSVLIDWGWGDTKLTGVNEEGEEYFATIEELYEEIGMGEWGEWDEMIDNIKLECYDFIKSNCGFGIWFDDEQ